MSQLAFGKSFNALSDPEFRSLPVRVFLEYLQSLHVMKAFLIVRVSMQTLPQWIAKRVSHTIDLGSLELWNRLLRFSNRLVPGLFVQDRSL